MSDDPFAVMGLPHRIDVDRAALHRAYLQKSAAHHPDSGAIDEADDAQQELRIAELNRAKATLEDPESRAVALLQVLARRDGVKFAPADERALPDGFLAEMLETREQMESDKAVGDPALMQRWSEWAEERRRERQHSVRTLFLSIDGQAPAPVDTLRAIRRELNAWRYIERMLEQMHTPPAI